MVGSVTDPSGAAVPNAAITITAVETGQVRNLMSATDGQFVVPDLHIGRYTARAVAKGFKAVDQKDIMLAIGDRTRIDFKLQVGSATEEVTVEAAAIAVQADTGEVSDVISGQQISQLSTNGRSMYSLISLTPGASSGQGDFQTPTPVGGDANVSFNGLRESHNLYLLDGSESSDRGGAGGSDVMPSLDAIAEFRELTSNYSAEFGLSSAATMTAVIKGGTNRIHAAAWEFLRNDALDARNYFNPAPQKVAELRFNTYGFNIGGPVTFGKLYNENRSKTFFFYNMEWRSLIQGATLNQTVPSTAWYNGALPANLPITVPSTVPASILYANCGGVAPAGVVPGQPFPNNTIPSCMLDPNAQALLTAGIFPANNSVNGSGQPTFEGGNNSPTKVREEIIRIDHNFNKKFSIFGHWVDEQISQDFGTSMWSGDNVPTASNTFGNPSFSGVIHTTYVISPTLLNEVAFNYNGNRINIVPQGVIARPSGFTSQRIFGGPNNQNRIPEINLAGYDGTDYTTSSWPWHNKADDYQIRDDISWTRGAHQFRMGGSWAIYKKVQDLFGNTQGSFKFNNTFTGNDFADFLLGEADSYTELAVQDHGYWNNVSWAAYVQDNWRATHRLTLNLGLRWDGVPHTYEANDRMGNFYPNLYNPASAAIFVPGSNGNAICGGNPLPAGCSVASPGLGTSPNPILSGYQFYLNGIGIPGTTPGVPHGLVQNHWAAFGPRIGFAYDVTGSGKTILRGGFGTMYERIQGNDMYNAGPNVPFSTNVTFNNVTLVNPSTSLASGNTLVAPITVASITGLDSVQNKLPVSYQYSFGVQHALSSRTVLSVSYVGNQNRHQNDYRETNLPSTSDFGALLANNGSTYNTLVPYLGFNSIKLSEDVQNSHYNGFQAELHSQLRRDLSVQAAYTLSRAIDPATSGNGVSDLNATSNPYSHAYDNGPSGLDRTSIAFVNFVYDIPFLRDNPNRLLRSTVGGWQVSGIVTAVSGEPLNITEGGITNCAQLPAPTSCTGSLAGTGNIGSIIPNSNNRPNVNGSVSTPHTVASWFSGSAFSPTVAGTWGNEPFNALRAPGRDNWNLSLFKSFAFDPERGSRAEFRAEFFNVWNHTELNSVSTTYSSGNFGAVTSAHDPREIQLGIKLYF